MLKSVSLSIGTLLLMFIEMGSMSNNNILPLNKFTVKAARHKRQAWNPWDLTKVQFTAIKNKMKFLIDENAPPSFPININVKLDPVSQMKLGILYEQMKHVVQPMVILQDKTAALKLLAKELDTIFKIYVEKFPIEESFINNIPGLLTFLKQMKPDPNGVLHLDQNNPKIKFIIHEILLHMEDKSKVDPFNPYILNFIDQNQNLLYTFRNIKDVKVGFDIKLNVEGELELQEIIDGIESVMNKFQVAEIFPAVDDKTELQDVVANCKLKWEIAAEVQCQLDMNLSFLDDAMEYLTNQASPRKKRDAKTKKCEELWPFIAKMVCPEFPASDLRFPPGHGFWD